MRTVLMAVSGSVDPRSVLSIYHTMVREPERIILVQVRRPVQQLESSDAMPENDLRRFRQELENIASARVTTVVRDGACHEDVLKVAQEEAADLIIIGCSRTRGLRRLMNGGFVRNIERHALVPVIVAADSPHGNSIYHDEKGRELYAA